VKSRNAANSMSEALSKTLRDDPEYQRLVRGDLHRPEWSWKDDLSERISEKIMTEVGKLRPPHCDYNIILVDEKFYALQDGHKDLIDMSSLTTGSNDTRKAYDVLMREWCREYQTWVAEPQSRPQRLRVPQRCR